MGDRDHAVVEYSTIEKQYHGLKNKVWAHILRSYPIMPESKHLLLFVTIINHIFYCNFLLNNKSCFYLQVNLAHVGPFLSLFSNYKVFVKMANKWNLTVLKVITDIVLKYSYIFILTLLWIRPIFIHVLYWNIFFQ